MANTPQWNPASIHDDWGAFNQILKNFMLQNIFTVDIVQVQSVNEDNTVDVVSVFKMKTTDGSALPKQEPIYKVPVFILRGGGCEITIPVSIGDKGVLLALKYDPKSYYEAKETSFPSSSLFFNLSNGVFLPLDFGYSPNGVTIKNSNATIVLKEQEISLNVTSSSEDSEEEPSSSWLVLTPTTLTGEIQASVSLKTGSAEITADSVVVNSPDINLGDGATQGVARIGDTVTVAGVTGTITSGSGIVKSA